MTKRGEGVRRINMFATEREQRERERERGGGRKKKKKERETETKRDRVGLIRERMDKRENE